MKSASSLITDFTKGYTAIITANKIELELNTFILIVSFTASNDPNT
jgi:hypothetical protein